MPGFAAQAPALPWSSPVILAPPSTINYVFAPSQAQPQAGQRRRRTPSTTTSVHVADYLRRNGIDEPGAAYDVGLFVHLRQMRLADCFVALRKHTLFGLLLDRRPGLTIHAAKTCATCRLRRGQPRQSARLLEGTSRFGRLSLDSQDKQHRIRQSFRK